MNNENTNVSLTTALTETSALISAQNLSKTFEAHKGGRKNTKITALDGACLSIKEGQKIGIVGKSGEGKSTFARILCGFEKPDDGTVLFDDVPLFDSKKRYDQKRGTSIQMISQQPYQSLDPSQKVGKAIEETLIVAKKVSNRKEARSAACDLFQKVLLDLDLYDRLPSQLSGGQAQRVAIARALALSPRVIISDEATSMLDLTSQAQIISLFEKLADENNLTIILISHDEALVNAFSDESYRLINGIFTKCVTSERDNQDGSPQNTLNNNSKE